MLNICTKYIVISCDVIWINKTYGDYVSRKETTKMTSDIFQDEYDYDKWAYVKIDPVRTEDVQLEKR